MKQSGMRGVLNDAVSIYFADATLAGAFVARWCVGAKKMGAPSVMSYISRGGQLRQPGTLTGRSAVLPIIIDLVAWYAAIAVREQSEKLASNS
jgi:hypothetical protein